MVVGLIVSFQLHTTQILHTLPSLFPVMPCTSSTRSIYFTRRPTRRWCSMLVVTCIVCIIHTHTSTIPATPSEIYIHHSHPLADDDKDFEFVDYVAVLDQSQSCRCHNSVAVVEWLLLDGCLFHYHRIIMINADGMIDWMWWMNAAVEEWNNDGRKKMPSAGNNNYFATLTCLDVAGAAVAVADWAIRCFDERSSAFNAKWMQWRALHQKSKKQDRSIQAQDLATNQYRTLSSICSTLIPLRFSA